MALTFAQKRAVAKFNAVRYEQILVRVRKGKRAAIQKHAQARGESMNAFVNRAIDAAMEREAQ